MDISLQKCIEFQRAFRDLVKENPNHWPKGELDYAEAILKELKRLEDVDSRREADALARYGSPGKGV